MSLDHQGLELGRRVLVVDDDAGLREAMAGYLSAHGLQVHTASCATTMERILARSPVDVVVLDVIMPPGEDGLSVCRRISANDGPPVILLSDGAMDVDRIVGLELGADDYLSKPCNPRELLARVRAVMRRGWTSVGADFRLVARFAGWRLDLLSRDLRDPDGAVIELSAGEYALLRIFIEHPQRVLSRDQLVEYAITDTDSADRAIDVQICRLRKKLTPGMIRTIRHEGYVFTAKVSHGETAGQ